MRYLAIVLCLFVFVSCAGHNSPVVTALLNADFVRDHGDPTITHAGYDGDMTFVGIDTDGDGVFNYQQYYSCPNNRLPVTMTAPGGYKLNDTGCVKRR